MNGPAEGGRGIEGLCRNLGVEFGGWVMERWVLVSVLLQMILSGLLLMAAVWFVDPMRKRN